VTPSMSSPPILLDLSTSTIPSNNVAEIEPKTESLHKVDTPAVEETPGSSSGDDALNIVLDGIREVSSEENRRVLRKIDRQ